MSEERSMCEYCHGNTFMDSYGNCRACGAQKKLPASYYQPTYVRNIPDWKSGICGVISTEAFDYPKPGDVWDRQNGNVTWG